MNKPVAWQVAEMLFDIEESAIEMAKVYGDKIIPLYTHPVKEEAEQQSYQEADGCPTELAVLKRFWRQHNPVKEPMMVLDGNRVYPAFKELTDEEIEEIGKQYLSAHAQFIGAGECSYEGEIEFARAILRKAQEK